MSKTFMRLPAVKAKTGLGQSSIYDRMAAGTFPKPVRLDGKAVGWVDEEVDQWIEDRIRHRDATAGEIRPHPRRKIHSAERDEFA